MSIRTPISVDVWWQHDGYGISMCYDDGDSQCIGMKETLDEAWLLGCDVADGLGIPARELNCFGQAIDVYQPEFEEA